MKMERWYAEMPSFILFWNFELLAARKDIVNLQALADYTIHYFYPEIQNKQVKRSIWFFIKK